VARVTLEPEPGVERDPLFGEVLRRRTHRTVYYPRAVPPSDLAALLATPFPPAVVVGGTLEPGRSASLSDLAMEGFAVEVRTARTWGETVRLLMGGRERDRPAPGRDRRDEPLAPRRSSARGGERGEAPRPGGPGLEERPPGGGGAGRDGPGLGVDRHRHGLAARRGAGGVGLPPPPPRGDEARPLAAAHEPALGGVPGDWRPQGAPSTRRWGSRRGRPPCRCSPASATARGSRWRRAGSSPRSSGRAAEPENPPHFRGGRLAGRVRIR